MNAPIDYHFFPVLDRHGIHDGALQDCHVLCQSCFLRSCRSIGKIKPDTIYRCNCGINYFRLNDDLVATGILIDDSESCSVEISIDPQLNVIKIKRSGVDRFISAFRTPKTEPRFIGHDHFFSADHIHNPISDELLSRIKSAAGINGYCNELFKHISLAINADITSDTVCREKLDNAPLPLRRAYWGSRYLQEQIRLLQLAMEPETLLKTYNCIPFHPSTVLSRQLEIFVHRFQAKQIGFNFNFNCYKMSMASPDAVNILFHVLLDNAIRYAPAEEKIKVDLEEIPGGQKMSVIARGTRIGKQEKALLFQPGYRGKAVQKDHSGRLGIGLFAAAMVAEKHLGSSISLVQDAKPDSGGYYRTQVSVVIPDEAAIIM